MTITWGGGGWLEIVSVERRGREKLSTQTKSSLLFYIVGRSPVGQRSFAYPLL
jgi:hypothetical protein